MHLDCLPHVSPVISCRLCLVDWAAGHGAGRSGGGFGSSEGFWSRTGEELLIVRFEVNVVTGLIL